MKALKILRGLVVVKTNQKLVAVIYKEEFMVA
jgi:hypothetical protein